MCLYQFAVFINIALDPIHTILYVNLTKHLSGLNLVSRLSLLSTHLQVHCIDVSKHLSINQKVVHSGMKRKHVEY